MLVPRFDCGALTLPGRRTAGRRGMNCRVAGSRLFAFFAVLTGLPPNASRRSHNVRLTAMQEAANSRFEHCQNGANVTWQRSSVFAVSRAGRRTALDALNATQQREE
jgi:hypothetical protein